MLQIKNYTPKNKVHFISDVAIYVSNTINTIDVNVIIKPSKNIDIILLIQIGKNSCSKRNVQNWFRTKQTAYKITLKYQNYFT